MLKFAGIFQCYDGHFAVVQDHAQKYDQSCNLIGCQQGLASSDWSTSMSPYNFYHVSRGQGNPAVFVLCYGERKRTGYTEIISVISTHELN